MSSTFCMDGSNDHETPGSTEFIGFATSYDTLDQYAWDTVSWHSNT